MTVTIRDASTLDAAQCLAIYAPFVRDTAISFELDVPSVHDFAERISKAQRRHVWLVAESSGSAEAETSARVVGYACAGRYRDRPAYDHVCEASIYLASEAAGRGIGRALYADLFDRLAERGLEIVIAGIALPNAASQGMHRALGFEPVGVHPRVGYKFGQYWDVEFLQRDLPRT